MTVNELINKLNTIKDKSITVTINPYVALYDGSLPQAIRPYPIIGISETYSTGLYGGLAYKKGSFNIDIQMRLFDKYQRMDSQEQVSAPPKPKKTTKSKRRK